MGKFNGQLDAMKTFLHILTLGFLLTGCGGETSVKNEMETKANNNDSLSSNIKTTKELNGTLCYPSDYVPKMTVFLQDVATKKIHKIITQEDQRSFKFMDVPYGDYYAYAYTIEQTLTDSEGNSSKASGGFTKAVPCGLTVECNDHTLIHIKIDNEITKDTISICDWYGAIVPGE